MIYLLPKVSFVISTRNRCDTLLDTLGQIHRCGLDEGEFDIYVIDNASTDGTSRRVTKQFPKVKLTTLAHNRGSVAKNEALDRALGKYIVFLDDDSYPLPGAIPRMIRYFETDLALGAATFAVTLPDGRQECSAYPDVFIGCGVGIRRRALRLVGKLPEDFFMQAEEYDLSLRLLEAGWKIQRFEDLHVRHLKSPQSRLSARTMRLDVRNNLYLSLRRMPLRSAIPHGRDWMRRYYWIAKSKGMTGAFAQGVLEGTLRSIVRPRRQAVSEQTFELFAKLDETQRRLRAVLEQTDFAGTGDTGTVTGNERDTPSLRVAGEPPERLDAPTTDQLETLLPADQRRLPAPRVVLIDLGKNIRAYYKACQSLGVQVVAIADNHLAANGRKYRGIPIVTDEAARKLKYDLAIVANLSPVHAGARRDHWRLSQQRPVVDLFEPGFEARHGLEQPAAETPVAAGPITFGRPAGSESHRTVARSA